MNIYLYLVELFHFINELFISFYIFIFRTNKYDNIYVLYIFLIVLSWLFLKNECIISYIEKKLLDNTYKLGNLPYIHPYQTYYPKNLQTILRFFKFLNFVVILFRNTKNIYIILMTILIFIIQIRYIYLYKYG